MKTFKQWLKESFGPDLRPEDFVFSGSRQYIPLNSEMIDEIFGKVKLIKSCHITSEDGLKNLITMQNSLKQVSTFTKIDEIDIEAIQNGIAGRGGVLVMLEGYPVVQLATDGQTERDSSGQKWIQASRVSFDFYDDFVKEKVKLMNKYNAEGDVTIQEFAKIISNKDKVNFIKDYMLFCKKIIVKNIKLFKSFFKTGMKEESIYSWNEIILNQFKIKKVYVVYQSDGAAQEKVSAENFKKKWKKYKADFLPTLGFTTAAFKAINKWVK